VAVWKAGSSGGVESYVAATVSGVEQVAAAVSSVAMPVSRIAATVSTAV
jgi:hypothetical protein